MHECSCSVGSFCRRLTGMWLVCSGWFNVENTKAIQYRLRNGQSVEVTINWWCAWRKGFDLWSGYRKTIVCHLGFTEEVSKKHGVAIWRTMDTAYANSLLLVPIVWPRWTSWRLRRCLSVNLWMYSAIHLSARVIWWDETPVTPLCCMKDRLLACESRAYFKLHALPFPCQRHNHWWKPTCFLYKVRPQACNSGSKLLSITANRNQSYVSFRLALKPGSNSDYGYRSALATKFLIGKSIIRAEELDQYITCTMTDEVKSWLSPMPGTYVVLH